MNEYKNPTIFIPFPAKFSTELLILKKKILSSWYDFKCSSVKQSKCGGFDSKVFRISSILLFKLLLFWWKIIRSWGTKCFLFVASSGKVTDLSFNSSGVSAFTFPIQNHVIFVGIFFVRLEDLFDSVDEIISSAMFTLSSAPTVVFSELVFSCVAWCWYFWQSVPVVLNTFGEQFSLSLSSSRLRTISLSTGWWSSIGGPLLCSRTESMWETTWLASLSFPRPFRCRPWAEYFLHSI